MSGNNMIDEDKEIQNNIDLYYLIGEMWRNKKFILIFTFIVAVFSIIYALTATKIYMSKVSMYPITKDQGGPLKELATSLGLGSKPEGYYLPDVIYSRRISKSVIYKKYKTEAFNDSVNLIQFWELDKIQDTENNLFELANTRLLNSVFLKEDKETTLITLTINTTERKLSFDIAQSYCDAITTYLQNALRVQIQQSIIFTEQRLEEVRKELIQSETELIVFQEANTKATSPSLSVELKRRFKKIELIQDVEILLKKQLELLKIEEVKLKPVMNILDPPMQFDRHIKPLKRKVVFISTFIGFIFSYGFVLLNSKIKRDNVLIKLRKEIGLN